MGPRAQKRTGACRRSPVHGMKRGRPRGRWPSQSRSWHGLPPAVTQQRAARPPRRHSPLLGHGPPAQTFLPSFPAATINTQRTKQEREWEVERPPRRQGLGTPLVPSNRNDMPNALLPLTQMRRREGCGAAGRKEPRSLRDHRTQRAPHPRGPPPSKHSDGKNPTSSWRTDAGGQEGGRLKQGCVSAHRVRDYALEESTRKTLGKRQNYRDEK